MTKPPELLSNKQRYALMLSIASAAALYLLAILYAGYEDIQTTLLRFGVSNWLILLACSSVNYLLRFVRWQRYISQSGQQIPLKLHFLYYLAGFALTTTPGKAGETIRSMLLRPHGVRYSFSLACFFTERLLDVMAIALLASLTVYAFSEHSAFVIATSLGVLTLLPYLRSRLFAQNLKSLRNAIRHKKVRHLCNHLMQLARTSQKLMRWNLLGVGFGLGLSAWLIQGLAFYLIVSQLGFDIGLSAAIGIYAISLLAGAVSFIPGGVGSTEVMMGLLLAALGADSSIIVSAPLISRLSTLWYAVMLGLLASAAISMARQNSTSSTK